jgi:hypothetical protein
LLCLTYFDWIMSLDELQKSFLDFSLHLMKISKWNLICNLFLDFYTLSLSSVMLDILLTEFWPVKKNHFSRIFSESDEDISVKFYIWLWLVQLQTKFDFCYTWPTSDWIMSHDELKESVFLTFHHIGRKFSAEIQYMASYWMVTSELFSIELSDSAI